MTTHTDYSENVLPRLKRNYLRKCQEAEVRSTSTPASPADTEAFQEYKAAIQLNSQSPISPTDGQAMTSPHSAKPNPGIGARPAIITAPQPLRPLDRRPSVGATSNHARSPSTSTSTTLQDLAHQGALLFFGGSPKSDVMSTRKEAAQPADDFSRQGREYEGLGWSLRQCTEKCESETGSG